MEDLLESMKPSLVKRDQDDTNPIKSISWGGSFESPFSIDMRFFLNSYLHCGINVHITSKIPKVEYDRASFVSSRRFGYL